MSKIKKIVVFGGGRMGLSHAAMAGLLASDLRTIIVEPSFKTRMILKLISGWNVKVKSKISKSDIREATHAVVATPPLVHRQNINLLRKSGFCGRLLIEKPVSVSLEEITRFDSVMSGYVLRHSYFWQLLKSRLKNEKIHKVSVLLETNQDFGATGDGWRVQEDAPGLSLLSEFGSHCINLVLDIVPVGSLSVMSNEINHVKLSSQTNGAHLIELKANSRDVRKSVYSVIVETAEGTYTTDFYSLSKTLLNGTVVESSSLAAEGVHTRAYLRGIEFCQQMEMLLGETPIDSSDILDAINTDQILTKLEGDIRCRK